MTRTRLLAASSPSDWLASSQQRTRVNLRKLGDLAEVFGAVVQKAERDELEIVLPKGRGGSAAMLYLFIRSET
jgi:hypothetical protein